MKTVLVIVNTDRNFTPRDLMAIAARRHSNMTFAPGLWNDLFQRYGSPSREAEIRLTAYLLRSCNRLEPINPAITTKIFRRILP